MVINLEVMVTILVEFTFLKDHAHAGKELLKKLASASLEEKGCSQYTLMEDVNDEQVVVLFEVFENKEAQAFHKTTEHYKHYLEDIIPSIIKDRKVRYLK